MGRSNVSCVKGKNILNVNQSIKDYSKLLFSSGPLSLRSFVLTYSGNIDANQWIWCSFRGAQSISTPRPFW